MLFLIYCHKCAVTPMGAGIKHEINACATDPSELKAQPTALNAQPQTVFSTPVSLWSPKKLFKEKYFIVTGNCATLLRIVPPYPKLLSNDSVKLYHTLSGAVCTGPSLFLVSARKHFNSCTCL